MAAETARQFEALERQAQTLMSAFVAAGYEAVAPAIIQPAGVFLDVVGEALRARTYVFNDPDGHELCLRPDLTVPTCRLFLERGAKTGTTAKYCYNGAAFRFQPASASATHPREFRQAGIENFGNVHRAEADAETVRIIVSALKAAGLKNAVLRFGDLGLMQAILEASGLPEGQIRRLWRAFRRPGTFRDELDRLSRGEAATTTLPAELRLLIKGTPGEAERSLAQYLEAQAIEAVGARALSEIIDTLKSRQNDAAAPPLKPAIADLLNRYANLAIPLRDAKDQLASLSRAAGLDISRALDTFAERLRLLTMAGVDVSMARYSTAIGRSLEYYTGFVFDLVLPELGTDSPIAAGGRYDGLMKAIGAGGDIPAVGAAIHTERLLAAAGGERP
jgi:ATP phosphoribosyltransferase regulatory subunit